MEEARLGRQTRIAATFFGRVLGRADVATTKIGGRNVSRPAFRLANVAEESRVYRRRGAHAGAGNWREYGAIHPFQCGRIAALAGQRPGTRREGLSERVGEVRARGCRVEQHALLS